MLDVKTFLANLPHKPGIYQMFGENQKILYIGKAKNLKKRVSSYFNKKFYDQKTKALIKHVVDIEVTVTNNEIEALLLESNFIKKYQPHYNVLFRDDKSYPYILITEEEFPQIGFYRGSRKRSGTLFGPFPSAQAVRQSINLIEKLFHLRTCTNHFFKTRKRPCLQYQINRCTGPCVQLVSKEQYSEQVRHAILFLQGKNTQIIEELQKTMEEASAQLKFEQAAKVRNEIRQLQQVQMSQHVVARQGNVDVVGLQEKAGVICIQLFMIRGGRMLGSRSYFPRIPLNTSSKKVLTSFIEQHYLTLAQMQMEIPEEIILNFPLLHNETISKALFTLTKRKIIFSLNVRGERKKWLNMAMESASQALIGHITKKTHLQERFIALAALLKLTSPPKRIECFDVSHSHGEETVASCIVFNTSGAVKSDYRRFIITNVTKGDDVAAMQQTILRRYKKITEDALLPDIILIDGGKAQLMAAKTSLESLNITKPLLLSVSKGVFRKPGYETLHFVDKKKLYLPPDSNALHLIQQIRDEAHRFAIFFHRNRRDKKRSRSQLEDIPGVGVKRRVELLKYFGGMDAINHASLEDLIKVPGINKALANKIYALLHNIN